MCFQQHVTRRVEVPEAGKVVCYCPLGHKQKDRSGYAIHPDVIVRICDTCGVVFDPEVSSGFVLVKSVGGERHKQNK